VLDLFASLSKSQTLLEKVLAPDGFNVGINLSKSAGAGIVGHLHIHILPRWVGDTNFMPTIFNTKVISQSLDQLHKQLKHAYSEKN
jgi:ATP adenylyltransferase